MAKTLMSFYCREHLTMTFVLRLSQT